MTAQLRAAGHRIIAVSRRAEPDLADPTFTAYACDLSDPAATEAQFGRIVTAHPDITVVINNAGIQLGKRLDDPVLDSAALEREVTINLLAPAIIARAFMPVMLRQDQPCAIVNVSSGLAFHPKTTTALYCASKAGLHSLSQSLRYQAEGSRLKVIEAVLPLVDTPMTTGRGNDKLSAKACAAAIIAGIKAGKDEVYVGKARLLAALNRIAPAIPRAILKRS